MSSRFTMRLKQALGITLSEADVAAAEQRYDLKAAWAAMSPAEQREARAWAERVCDEDTKNTGAKNR
jgi:hypothetical protein